MKRTRLEQKIGSTLTDRGKPFQRLFCWRLAEGSALACSGRLAVARVPQTDGLPHQSAPIKITRRFIRKYPHLHTEIIDPGGLSSQLKQYGTENTDKTALAKFTKN